MKYLLLDHDKQPTINQSNFLVLKILNVSCGHGQNMASMFVRTFMGQ